MMISSGSEVLVESTIRVSIAAAALWIGLRLLRVGNARVQKLAWTMVLLAAIAMPLLVGWQGRPAWTVVQVPVASWSTWATTGAENREQRPVVRVLPLRAAEQTAQPVRDTRDDSTAAASAPADFNVEPSAAYRPSEKSPQTAATPGIVPTQSRISGLLAIKSLAMCGWFLYLGVGVALVLRLLWGLVSTLRLWREAEPVEATVQFDALRGVELRWSRTIASPVNIGSGILLPANYAEWDNEKLRVVLAHELSHVRQRDFYLQMAASIYAAITWLSPLGWWLKRKLAELGEAISDHAGLEAASSPSAYAEVLLEFAALPRPTVAGVAMAHSTNLHQRIERLLNETSFRSAFALQRRALAALVIPVVLIGAAALVRVEAAASQTNVPPRDAKLAADALVAQTDATERSNPTAEQAANAESSQAEPAPASPEPVPEPAPAPAVAQTPQVAPVPLEMPVPVMPIVPSVPPIAAVGPIERLRFGPGAFRFDGLEGVYEFNDFDGDPYAIVGDPGTKTHFSGDWDDDRGALVERARAVAHGHFLLFERDGKYYVVDDPASVSQLESMEKAISDQREQMHAMSKQMHEQAEQAREEARKARASAEKVPAPDIAKEMADLNAAVAALKADQGGTISREQLVEIQRKLSEVQRRLINVEVKVDVNMNVNQTMREMWADEGKIGQQMGQIGGEIGRIARENNSKIRSIIDESLKNGKAKPVN